MRRPGVREDLCWHHERRYTRVYEQVAEIVLAAVGQLGLPTAPLPPRTPARLPARNRASLLGVSPGQADEDRQMSA